MKKTLIITGGSRGIGEKTCELFLADGWEVVNLSRTPGSLDNVKHIALDLADPNTFSHPQFAEQFAAGRIVLVHNAAYYRPDAMPTLAIEELTKTLQINLISPVIINQALIPKMSAGSAIIYIGTTLAEKAVPGSASYSISKHGLMGLMKSTCQDLIGKPIHSCCVSPGLVETKLLRDTMDVKTIEFLLENKVIGKRLIQPEEIAKVVQFCALNNVLNGAIIHANLGQVAE